MPRCGSAAKRYAQEQQLKKLEYTLRSIPASVNVESKESERSDAKNVSMLIHGLGLRNYFDLMLINIVKCPRCELSCITQEKHDCPLDGAIQVGFVKIKDSFSHTRFIDK